MSVKLAYLRDFIAVAQAGTIRAAAKQLGLSQAAVSKSIQQLEREVDAPLFARHANGVTLTAMGQAYLLRAQTAVQELRKGEDEVRQLRGAAGGSLAMGISSVPSLMLLPEVISQFRRQYPDTQVRIVGGGLSVAFPLLRDGLLDFSISPHPVQKINDDFVFEALFRNECVVVARHGHPLQHARSLAQLLQAEWLVAGATDLDSSTHHSAFASHQLGAPRRAVRCEYVPAFLSLLTSSDMVMILPRIWVESQLGFSKLRIIEVAESLPAAEICVIRRKGLAPTPAAEHMLALVRRWVHRHEQSRAMAP